MGSADCVRSLDLGGPWNPPSRGPPHLSTANCRGLSRSDAGCPGDAFVPRRTHER